MDDSCAVCTEALEWVAYGPCNHREVCSTCVSRLRFICNDRRCCICKTVSDKVFITKALGDYTKTISDFSVLQEQTGNYWYHEETGAYFDDYDHYNNFIKPMCRLSCGVCEKNGEEQGGKFSTIEQLKNHLFHRHNKIMCILCLEGRKSFICEQKLYSRPQLDRHILTGDSEVDGDEMERGGFSGHPMCEFCKKRFYGETELYQHMSTQHFTCHICKRLRPEEQFQYYRTYDDLEVHFGSEHFLCEDKECLAKKFVVFASETEFKRHNVIEHGGNISKAQRNAALQVPTGFQYLRNNEQANNRRHGRRQQEERGDLDDRDHSPPSSVHPVPNSEVRGHTFEDGSPPLEEEYFPPLPNASPINPRIVQNRVQNPRNVPLSESFPPLPGASTNNLRNVQALGQNTRSNQSVAPLIPTASTSKMRKPKNAGLGQVRMDKGPPLNSNDRTGNVPNSTDSGPAAAGAFPSLPSVSTSNLRSVELVGQTSRPNPVIQSPSPPISIASSSKSKKPKSAGSSKSRMAAPSNQNNNDRTINVPNSANSGIATSNGIASSPITSSQANYDEMSPPVSGNTSQFKEVVTKGGKLRSIQAATPASSTRASRNSLSFHNLAEEGASLDSSIIDFPPIYVPKKNELPASSEPKLEDAGTAHDSIWETIRTALEFDENKRTSFRDLCAQYRQGVIGADKYLAHVQEFGLSHLVLDLARLYPDVQMQRDLLKTYNASLRSDGVRENGLSVSDRRSKGSYSLNKSMGKAVESADNGSSTSSNGVGSGKQPRKNSKSHKIQLVQIPNSGTSSPSETSTARVKHHSGSLDSSVVDFPPIPVPKKNELPASNEPKVDDAQAAIDSVWEKIRSALEFDENKYTAFRDLSEEYRQGAINAGEYLSYVQQFGLTNLVLELSRLFPDPHMQKDLLSTYNASVRSGNSGESNFSISDNQLGGSNRSKKSKSKSIDKKNSKKLPLVHLASSGGYSPSTTSTSQVTRHTEERRGPLEEFPPIPATKKESPPNSEPKVDVNTANNALVEMIRSTLEFDENKYTVFRDLSEEYGQGMIGAGEYLSYIEQFGLSHLVLDLVRLCPDTWKQRELLETYNASVRSDGENNGLIIGSSSSSKSNAKQPKKKTTKAQRLQLCNDFEQQSEVVPCVWGNGGGKKLVTLN